MSSTNGRPESAHSPRRQPGDDHVTVWIVVFQEQGKPDRVHPEGMTQAGAEGFAESYNRRESGVGKVAVARRIDLAAGDLLTAPAA